MVLEIDGTRWRVELLHAEALAPRQAADKPARRGVRFTHVETGEVRSCCEPDTHKYISVLALTRHELIDCFRRAT